MSEPATETPVEAPARKFTVKKRKAAKRFAAKPKAPDDTASRFAGMTVTKCPTACTEKKCIISTVDVCKHCMTTSASGCGPVTLANREAAMKYLKHQAVERG